MMQADHVNQISSFRPRADQVFERQQKKLSDQVALCQC
jgi:hypothetical protein